MCCILLKQDKEQEMQRDQEVNFGQLKTASLLSFIIIMIQAANNKSCSKKIFVCIIYVSVCLMWLFYLAFNIYNSIQMSTINATHNKLLLCSYLEFRNPTPPHYTLSIMRLHMQNSSNRKQSCNYRFLLSCISKHHLCLNCKR